ncbi:alanine racemase [Anaerostipes sp. MSJ-23]|uniref:alanine racemase n=1 Tax=Anaerostipes sp. MSJ-23 TaxID=2841520 RepID=UPI001C0FBD55|nr:alanine racemase [Anaerostipes sp. MSJ-23]MBU5460095.1 alanine racemase [Anaerostipes sp. MSJ-23]
MNEYYRVHAVIDLDAICHNIKEVKRVIGPDVKVMPVIKADGYGHGAVPIAKALNEIGADAFAVAIIEEGITLRKNGITQPIVILGYTSEYQYSSLIQYEIQPTVFCYEMAESLSKIAAALGQNAKIHIKLDTGMNRIGFKPTRESLEIVKKISKLPNIKIEGIFTHFACADEADKTSAKKQKAEYDKFIGWLSEEGIEIPVKHVSNSASIIDMKDWRMDMVRSGIITYGLYPSEEVSKDVLDLRPAMSLKTHIVYIKEVGPGEGVSYNHTFVTKRNTKIATIPVGYADGYPRALSSKGRVLIRGQYAPIIGRICMDQFMVDVTDIPDVSVMDEVTLVGVDGENRISVEEVANGAGSFNYEFVCGVSKRVPRVYMQNGKIKEAIEYMGK